MLKRKIQSLSMTTIAVALLVLTAVGCSEDDPTRPANSNAGDLTLNAANISVNGQSLNGQDIQQAGYDGPVRYEARLADHHGNPVTGGQVQVRYGMAGMMGHMGAYTHLGEFFCYDDGTHGDPVPGDGIFCFVDDGQEYGCHSAGARPGAYHYEFCGFDQHNHESNRLDIRVNLLP